MLRKIIRARLAKPTARISAYEDLLRQGSEPVQGTMELRIPPGPPLGNFVL